MLKNIRLERPLVVLDLETTGKKVQTDRIVEISLLKLLTDGTNKINPRRLNPGMPIPAEATAIHGITDADVANENYFRQIAHSLATYLEGCDLCGYNIWIFDLRMLVNEFKRAEVPFSVEGRHIIDPCRIFHKREPRDDTAALRFYCRMEHEGAHGAEADVRRLCWFWTARSSFTKTFPARSRELHTAMEHPTSWTRTGSSCGVRTA